MAFFSTAVSPGGVTKRSAAWGRGRPAPRHAASVLLVRARCRLPVCPAARGAAPRGAPRPASSAGGRRAVPSPGGGGSGRGRGGVRRERPPYAPETRSASRGGGHAKRFVTPFARFLAHGADATSASGREVGAATPPGTVMFRWFWRRSRRNQRKTWGFGPAALQAFALPLRGAILYNAAGARALVFCRVARDGAPHHRRPVWTSNSLA